MRDARCAMRNCSGLRAYRATTFPGDHREQATHHVLQPLLTIRDEVLPEDRDRRLVPHHALPIRSERILEMLRAVEARASTVAFCEIRGHRSQCTDELRRDVSSHASPTQAPDVIPAQVDAVQRSPVIDGAPDYISCKTRAATR